MSPSQSSMQRVALASAFVCAARSLKLQKRFALPCINNLGGSYVPDGTDWQFSVDHLQFYAPPEPASPITAFYYSYGASEGLTEEMKSRLVGVKGKYHMFYLPEGPSALTMPRKGDRRTDFSNLIQLTNDLQLHTKFPPYSASPAYVHPLEQAGQLLEVQAAKALTLDSVKEAFDGVLGVHDRVGYQTRSFMNMDSSAKTQAFLRSRFEAAGLTVCIHKFEKMGIELANVVGYLPGTGNSDDSVTLGAHYDSRPFQGTAPGAEDNGSGVAAMLAIVKALRSTAWAPKKHTYFVGFAAEEAGLYGSDEFARELQNGQVGIPQVCRLPSTAGTHQAIATDEVGWRSPKIAEPTVNLESYDSSDEVLQHLAAASRDLNGDDLKVVHSSNPFGSDHMSWLDRGMKAVLVINGDDEGYPDYHMSTDVYSNISPEYTTSISKMMLGGLMRMAGR